MVCLMAVMIYADNIKLALPTPLVADGSAPCNPMEINMVRGELRNAFASKPGYQVLTRDVDAIMKEQGFQQSGLVDDAQRKKMGIMMGAQYICSATITKYGTQLYIEAYLTDIETGQMTNPASQYINIKNENYSMLPNACNMLAEKMLGEISGKGESSSSAQASQSRPQEQYSAPAPAYNNSPSYHNAPSYSGSYGATSSSIDVHWSINSRPQGADIYWRVISKTPEVKNQNSKYLETTPYEGTETLNIPGLTRENAGNVQIEIKVEKNGYYTQTKKFNLSSLMDEGDVSIMFKLVPEE